MQSSKMWPAVKPGNLNLILSVVQTPERHLYMQEKAWDRELK